jgi:acyl dehydratase
MSVIRDRSTKGLQAGDSFSVTRRFTKVETEAFAELTRDYNPVHFEPRFAQAKGLPGLICHGLLVASAVTEIGGQIGWLASGMSFRFLKPVYIGDTVTCRLTITEVDDRGRAQAEAVFRNERGEIVLEASLGGIVPGAKEREVLRAMVAEGDPTNKVRDR